MEGWRDGWREGGREGGREQTVFVKVGDGGICNYEEALLLMFMSLSVA